jgi:transcriptional regulator with XRE-family HTH domain
MTRCFALGCGSPTPDTAVTPVTPVAPGSSLRARRLAMGLSQEQVARLMVVNHATVSRWESSMRRPAHDLVPALARVLGVSPADVESWFGHVATLGGDTIGRLPGLKRLLDERGADMSHASAACEVSLLDLGGWVYRRRSLPRFMVPRLARFLDLSESEFLREARLAGGARPGSFLRELRRDRGLTQNALGQRIGRTEAAICGWELGRVTPSPSSIRRLARALSVDDAELCGRMLWPQPSLILTSSGELGPHELIRLRRLEQGLSRAQVARCVGVTAQTVRRWEGGDFRPRRVALGRLSRVLQVPGIETEARRGSR